MEMCQCKCNGNVNLTNHSSLLNQNMFFFGKSKVCPMTEFSGANDSSGFDGNTLLLECENNEYVYVSGLLNFKFNKIIDCISLMGNNMIPYANIIGEE